MRIINEEKDNEVLFNKNIYFLMIINFVKCLKDRDLGESW